METNLCNQRRLSDRDEMDRVLSRTENSLGPRLGDWAAYRFVFKSGHVKIWPFFFSIKGGQQGPNAAKGGGGSHPTGMDGTPGVKGHRPPSPEEGSGRKELSASAGRGICLLTRKNIKWNKKTGKP